MSARTSAKSQVRKFTCRLQKPRTPSAGSEPPSPGQNCHCASAQVDALLVDYRTGTAQDAETTGAISAALLAYYTSAQVDALLADYRTASAQDTHHGRAAGLSDGPGPGRFHNQPNHLGAGACKFPDDGGADEVVAAIGEQILSPTDVSCQTGRFAPAALQRGPGHARGRLHPDPGSEPVEHRAHLQLDPGQELLFACRHRLGTASWRTCPRPTTSTTPCTAASWVTRAPGARPRCTSQCL